MGQQNRLEQQDNQAQHRHGSGPEQNCAETGAGGMAGGAGHAGELEGRQQEAVCACHSQQQQGFAVGFHDFADTGDAQNHEGQANHAPDHAVAQGQIALHDVHGSGGDGQTEGRGQNQGQAEQTAFHGFHRDDTPFLFARDNGKKPISRKEMGLQSSVYAQDRCGRQSIPRGSIEPARSRCSGCKGATFVTVAGPRGIFTLLPRISAHNLVRTARKRERAAS